MGNFMRRSLAFILGFIFAFVLLFGGIAGGAYWAFKNLTLGTLQIGEEESEVASWTIEDLTAFIIDVTKDPNSFTLKELEKHGFDLDELLTSMGVDLTTANPKDVESFKSLALASLFSENGLNNVGMGVVFLLLPKDATTGFYPVFSEGARNRLRQFSLGDFVKTDENGNLGAYSILRGMKLGSVLSSNFTETYEDGNFTYSSEDRGLNLLANVELGLFTDSLEGEQSDIGYEIKEGYLSHLKYKQLREIIASFGATDDASYQSNYEGLAILGEKTLDEIFVWNETKQWYELDISKIISIGTIGSMMGYEVCTNDENCQVHKDNLSLCDGELYENGVISETKGLYRHIVMNLCSVSVFELASGALDLNEMFDGVYLGSAFGYEMGELPTLCESDCLTEHTHVCDITCTKTHEHDVFCAPDCAESHVHNFYFVDENGVFVGNMYNAISNFAFNDALNGNLDLDSALEGVLIGEVMGYHLTDGVWYDESENLVQRNTIEERVLYQLYGKTIDDLSTIEFEDLVQGIKLGEILQLNKCTGIAGDCPVHESCDEEQIYWYNSDGVKTSALNNALADIELDGLMTDSNAIKTSLSTLRVGDLMQGYVLDGGVWKKSVGGSLEELNSLEKVTANISLGEVFDGTFDIKSQIDGVYIKDIVNVNSNKILSLVGECTINELPLKLNSMQVGEIMGYHLEGDTWYDDENNAVTGINKKLSNLTVESLSNGGFDTLLDGLVLGDVIDNYSTGSFAVMNTEGLSDANDDGVINAGDCPINDIATRVAEGAKNSSYQELENAGILEFESEVKNGLTSLYEGDSWKALTINEILTDVINKALANA